MAVLVSPPPRGAPGADQRPMLHSPSFSDRLGEAETEQPGERGGFSPRCRGLLGPGALGGWPRAEAAELAAGGAAGRGGGRHGGKTPPRPRADACPASVPALPPCPQGADRSGAWPAAPSSQAGAVGSPHTLLAGVKRELNLGPWVGEADRPAAPSRGAGPGRPPPPPSAPPPPPSRGSASGRGSVSARTRQGPFGVRVRRPGSPAPQGCSKASVLPSHRWVRAGKNAAGSRSLGVRGTPRPAGSLGAKPPRTLPSRRGEQSGLGARPAGALCLHWTRAFSR